MPNQSPKVLIAVLPRGKAEPFANLLNEQFKVGFSAVFLGEGTANAEVMDLLGFVETEKDVLTAIVHGNEIEELFAFAEEHLKVSLKGHGILFTIPLKSIAATPALMSALNLGGSK